MGMFWFNVGRFIRTPHELIKFSFGKIRVAWILEFRDVWVGIYWNKVFDVSSNALRWEVYIGIVPLLPIRIRGYI